MLKQDHEVMEKASALASAVKDERWGDPERIVQEIEGVFDILSNGVRDKVGNKLNASKSDRRDRG